MNKIIDNKKDEDNVIGTILILLFVIVFFIFGFIIVIIFLIEKTKESNKIMYKNKENEVLKNGD